MRGRKIIGTQEGIEEAEKGKKKGWKIGVIK